MEIKINSTENELLIKLEGRIDTTNSADFEKGIAPVLQSDMKNVVIDCEDLSYISSSGLRQFLILQKTAIAKKGNLKIRKMCAEVKSVFDMTGFTILFKFE